MSSESENKERHISSVLGRKARNGTVNENTWAHIHIHFNRFEESNPNTMEEVRSIESELKDKGVYFDTANYVDPHADMREWHTDWSLTGPMSVSDLCEYLENLGIQYNLWVVPKREE